MKIILTLALTSLSLAAFAGTTYSLNSIGNFPGQEFLDVYDLNDSGVVVGTADSSAPGATSTAFRWTVGGGFESLGGLGDGDAFARGINNAGNIVGASRNPAQTLLGTLWSPDGAPHSLGIPDGDVGSFAVAINNRDEAVGFSTGPGGFSTACLLSYGFARESLGTLPGGMNSSANAINDHGMVVGQSSTATGIQSFVWTRGDGMSALPSLGGDEYSIAADVNNQGEIVGNSYSLNGGNLNAFYYTATGGLMSMGTLNGDLDARVNAINDGGVAVGYSGDTSHYRAVTWQLGLGYTDLNTELGAGAAGWTLLSASSINSVGQILAFGHYQNGGADYYGSVLLTPNAAPVPEPASFAALGLGAAALLRRKGKA